MRITRILLPILGLVAAVVPARASLTFESSQTSFAMEAGNDGLSLSSLITFGSVSGDEYIDPTTGVEFFAFNSGGSTSESFLTTSSGELETTPGLGDSIEVVFPSTVIGFAFNLTTASGNETLCVDLSPATFSTCANGGTPAPGFAGVINESPLATLPTLWLHPLAGGSAATDVISFEVAIQSDDMSAPDVATFLSLGSGLILVACVRRRGRRRIA